MVMRVTLFLLVENETEATRIIAWGSDKLRSENHEVVLNLGKSGPVYAEFENARKNQA